MHLFPTPAWPLPARCPADLSPAFWAGKRGRSHPPCREGTAGEFEDKDTGKASSRGLTTVVVAAGAMGGLSDCELIYLGSKLLKGSILFLSTGLSSKSDGAQIRLSTLPDRPTLLGV